MSMVRDVTNAVVDGYTETFNFMFGTVPRIFLLILTMLYIQTAESSSSAEQGPWLVIVHGMPQHWFDKGSTSKSSSVLRCLALFALI